MQMYKRVPVGGHTASVLGGAPILGPGHLQVQTSDHKVGWGVAPAPKRQTACRVFSLFPGSACLANLSLSLPLSNWSLCDMLDKKTKSLLLEGSQSFYFDSLKCHRLS